MQSFKNRTIATLGAVLATVATVAASSPAHAETSTTVVSYAGLDLGSPAGEAILNRRIRAAAMKVCGPIDRTNLYRIHACRREAVANAKASLPGAAVRTQLALR